MLFSVLKVKDKEYKLRLPMKGLINLEKRLGFNPINVLNTNSSDGIPSFEGMMVVIQEALQAYQHGSTLDDAYNLYDEYIENDGTFQGFVLEFMKIFTTCGLMSEKQIEQAENDMKQVEAQTNKTKKAKN